MLSSESPQSTCRPAFGRRTHGFRTALDFDPDHSLAEVGLGLADMSTGVLAKLSITTRCNGRCSTCPVWKIRGQDMALADFEVIFTKLNESPRISKILLNSTGDMFVHPLHGFMLDYMAHHKQKWVTMTTNAIGMDEVPWGIDELIISFNGGTDRSYHEMVGVPIDVAERRIKRLYGQMEKRVRSVEMHCLICETNQGTEEALVERFKDFPGRIRVSYKYDNQFVVDRTLDRFREDVRLPCDYLGMIVVMPDGLVVQCSHDFYSETCFGNLVTDSVEDVMLHATRRDLIAAHMLGRYPGLCEECNYNTPVGDRLVYLT